jgi:3-oxoacyl-[acyl-carrier protein] reductase
MSEETTMTSQPYRLGGRRALVTGAASGIGRATAIRLAAEGAAVGVADVRHDAAAAVAAEITGAGGVATALTVDVADEQAVREAVAKVVDVFGGLDTVAVCAGILFHQAFEDLTAEDWQLVLSVNLGGAFFVLKHAMPHLCAAEGASIVTIGSVASLVAGGASAAYDASKGGLLQLTRAVAAEYADRGVRANCVCPGAVATNLRATSEQLTRGRAATSGGGVRRVQVPISRSADPAEIAAVVAFLCSEDASFMTGAAVPVDGGFTAV